MSAYYVRQVLRDKGSEIKDHKSSKLKTNQTRAHQQLVKIVHG